MKINVLILVRDTATLEPIAEAKWNLPQGSFIPRVGDNISSRADIEFEGFVESVDIGVSEGWVSTVVIEVRGRVYED